MRNLLLALQMILYILMIAALVAGIVFFIRQLQRAVEKVMDDGKDIRGLLIWACLFLLYVLIWVMSYWKYFW